MRRLVDCGLVLLLLLALTGFAGFAWLTHHPETPWLERAEAWPVVGELATRFRTAYLPPRLAEKTTPTPQGGVTVIYVEPEIDEPIALVPVAKEWAEDTAGSAPRAKTEPPAPALAGALVASSAAMTLGSSPNLSSSPPVDPVAFPAPGIEPLPWFASDWIWALPGNPVRSAAKAEATVQTRLAAMAYLPVLARGQGSWVQVLYNDRQGWLDTAWQPPHPRRRARRGILRERADPVEGNNWERLKKAQKVLGTDIQKVRFGAYDAWTDVTDAELLQFLDLAAQVVEEAYFARYGRLPSGDPRRSVVLFARREDYLRFSDSQQVLSTNHGGHAGGGIAAFFVGDLSRDRLASTLVHEITHLLNDRALARTLPPWLEEGMAGDLGELWFESTSAITTLGGVAAPSQVRWQGDEVWVNTPRFIRLGLAMRDGHLPLLTSLLGLDRKTFYQESNLCYAYAHSGAFIRFLVDGDNGRFAAGFRSFLQSIATGLHSDLLKHLEVDLETLDRSFQKWLTHEILFEEERLQRKVQVAAGWK